MGMRLTVERSAYWLFGVQPAAAIYAERGKPNMSKMVGISLEMPFTWTRTGIFILPPSMAALQARLTGRGQDDEAVIAGRMAVAVDEMRHYHQADYIIINDDFETALSDLQAVIQAQRLSRSQQQRQYKDLLAALIEDSDQ